MSDNMRYRDEIQYNVTGVLNALLRANGKVTRKFLLSEQERLRGQRASIVLDVAIVSLGLPMVLPLSECFGLNEQELGWLVEDAKKKNEGLILEIKKFREQREAKEQAEQEEKVKEIMRKVLPELEELVAKNYRNWKVTDNDVAAAIIEDAGIDVPVDLIAKLRRELEEKE